MKTTDTEEMTAILETDIGIMKDKLLKATMDSINCLLKVKYSGENDWMSYIERFSENLRHSPEAVRKILGPDVTAESSPRRRRHSVSCDIFNKRLDFSDNQEIQEKEMNVDTSTLSREETESISSEVSSEAGDSLPGASSLVNRMKRINTDTADKLDMALRGGKSREECMMVMVDSVVTLSEEMEDQISGVENQIGEVKKTCAKNKAQLKDLTKQVQRNYIELKKDVKAAVSESDLNDSITEDVLRRSQKDGHWDFPAYWEHMSKTKKMGHLYYFNEGNAARMAKELPGEKFADPKTMTDEQAWLYEGRMYGRTLIIGFFTEDMWKKELEIANQWKLKNYSFRHPSWYITKHYMKHVVNIEANMADLLMRKVVSIVLT